MAQDGMAFRVNVSPELRELFARSRALRNQRGSINVDLRINKGDCAVVITVDAPKESLLAAMASWLPAEQLRAFTLDTLTAEVVNNVIYIRPLEYGHSGQRPDGFMRLAIAKFAKYLTDEIQQGIDRHPNSPRQGLQAGIDSALLRIQAYLVANTPVKTGRAKGGWVLRRQDGALNASTGRSASRSGSGRGVLTQVVRAVADAAAEATAP